MNPNKRILINTIVLYVNLLVTIVVNLYSTRVILNALGVEDYGIVNLISGIVAMLSFIQNSMTVSTQRYLSINIGRGDVRLQSVIFNSSLVLHFFLALILFIIFESVAPVIFNSFLQIPIGRLDSAQILYQLTILSTLSIIIGVPYGATITAHENMTIYALISICESVMVLVGSLYLLSYGGDRLILYGVIIAFVRVVATVIMCLYCRHSYEETKIRMSDVHTSSIRQIAGFSFWNMLGAFAVACRYQGVAIVMNAFRGVVINAAFGIANQVSGQLSNFAATMNKAMAPQIMQREGEGSTSSMVSLAIKQCRYSSFLLAYAIIPLFIGMPYVLQLWLKEVPIYCTTFCRIMLGVAAVQQLTTGLQTAIQAKGNIKYYQVAISFFLMLNIPCAYFLLHFDVNPSFVIYAIMFVEMVCIIVRLVFSNKLVGLNYKDFLVGVFSPAVFVYIIGGSVVGAISQCVFGDIASFRSLLLVIVLSMINTTITVVICLSKYEKSQINLMLNKVLKLHA